MISKIRTQRVRILLPHPHSSLLDSGPRSKLPSVHPPKRTPSDLLLSKDRGGIMVAARFDQPICECRSEVILKLESQPFPFQCFASNGAKNLPV